MSADFWSSYTSGAVGILIGNPLDVLKTRIQAYTTPSPQPPPPTSTAGTAGTAGTKAPAFTGISSYLRGAPAPLLGYGALNAILFVTYNRALSLLGEEDYTDPRGSLARVWLAGAAGGLASFVVSAPTELVKCRVQVLESGGGGGGGGGGAGGGPAAAAVAPTGTATAATNSWAVAKEVVRRDGWRGLYFGGGVTAVRDAVGYGFYFWSYELLKRAWTGGGGAHEQQQQQQQQQGETHDAAAAVKVLVCGGVAGIVTWASIFPLDVVKTRVQTQPFADASSPPRAAAVGVSPGEGQPLLGRGAAGQGRRLGAVQIARQTYQNEGVAVFFRGLGICSVRAFIVNAAQWAVYEWMMQALRKKSLEEQLII